MLSDTMMLGGSGRKAAYSMENSLLFRGGQYLSRTPSVVGNTQKFTISLWVRRSATTRQFILGAGASNPTGLEFNADGTLQWQWSGYPVQFGPTVYRDVGAWFHIVLAWDTGQEADADRVKCWVNGVAQSHSGAAVIPIRYYGELLWNKSGVVHSIGNYPAPGLYTDAYIAEPVFVDEAALSASSFGEVDPVTLSWRPKVVSGITYGTNGFYLGKPWNSASLGTDYSGQGNTWAPSGFVASDVVVDTPTNVFATLNPLDASTCYTLAAGNTAYTAAGINTHFNMRGTLPITQKTYFEFEGVTANKAVVGVATLAMALTAGPNSSSECWAFATFDGTKVGGGGAWTAYGSAVSVGTRTAVAVDPANGKMWVGTVNAGVITWFNSGDPVAGTNAMFTNVGSTVFPFINNFASVVAHGGNVQFGAAGLSATPPTGFKTLCTANLPATTGQTSGSFTGNANADGPCIFTGAVPVTLTINGNAVTWGTQADKLATGFKIRTSSASYNASGSNSWVATYNKKPSVGSNHTPANAQANP